MRCLSGLRGAGALNKKDSLSFSGKTSNLLMAPYLSNSITLESTGLDNLEFKMKFLSFEKECRFSLVLAIYAICV